VKLVDVILEKKQNKKGKPGDLVARLLMPFQAHVKERDDGSFIIIIKCL